MENYRHFALIFEGEIYNKQNECITWNLMYKTGIFAENFLQYDGKFFPFKRAKQIENLVSFLSSRNIKNAETIAAAFYKTISYGFKFEDCYISDNQDCKILIYKKIELDESPFPCPSCNTTIQRGNSYPELFLRSYECQNPSCPDRSKSGRGRRFDEYGTYRYFKLVEGDKRNSIDENFYHAWHRDIFESGQDIFEFLLKEYSFADEKVFLKNCDIKNSYGRKIIDGDVALEEKTNALLSFENLPIVRIFREINKNITRLLTS